jgi:hypothetical protein
MKILVEYNVPLNKLIGICSDGADSLIGLFIFVPIIIMFKRKVPYSMHNDAIMIIGPPVLAGYSLSIKADSKRIMKKNE